MYRVGERIRLDLDAFVEVERLVSWPISFECARLAATYKAASTPEDEYAALTALYDYFVNVAQPQWDIVDGLGNVPMTGRGMMRLPLDLSLGMIGQWQDSLPKIVPSVVDEIIPAGPARQEIKRRLKKVA